LHEARKNAYNSIRRKIILNSYVGESLFFSKELSCDRLGNGFIFIKDRTADIGWNTKCSKIENNMDKGELINYLGAHFETIERHNRPIYTFIESGKNQDR